MLVAKEMLDNVADYPKSTFMKHIIPGGKTWVYEFYVETIQHSTQNRQK